MFSLVFSSPTCTYDTVQGLTCHVVKLFTKARVRARHSHTPRISRYALNIPSSKCSRALGCC